MDINRLTPPEIKNASPPALILKKGLHKDYSRNQSEVPMAIACIIIGFFVVIWVSEAGGAIIPAGIIMLILSFSTPLKFREDHFLYKPAPARETRKISYSAIDRIEYEKKKIIIYTGKEKLTLSKNLFSGNDWVNINRTFTSIKPE